MGNSLLNQHEKARKNMYLIGDLHHMESKDEIYGVTGSAITPDFKHGIRL